MADIVVVFDFDQTIIDCDSDNWVVDDLGGTKIFDELLRTMPWNSAMDKTMGELHSQGKSMEDISNSLKTAPLSASTNAAIKSAYALGCELKILSDANLFFIETILGHHGLTSYFSEIITNPGHVDDEGRLRISPYHDFNTSDHGCSSPCPPNMCKGMILERIRASALAQGKKQFIYLGDGKGDYCPSLKLTENDYVMPRKNFPLWDLISANASSIKAQVREWTDAEEQERVLIEIIHKAISEDRDEVTQLISMDCKSQNMPISAHKALPQALPVPR